MFSRRYSASSVPEPPDPQTGDGRQSNGPQSAVLEAFDTVATHRTHRNSAPCQCPRYSNLSSLPSTIAEHGSQVELSADDLIEKRWESYDAIHDRMSFMSLESNAATSTYMTLVPAGHSSGMRSTFSASTATVTNPPRYSSASYSYSAAAPREFEFAIRGGSAGPKGQPWATLKLYNGEARGGKRGKHPRYREGENIFGRVELSLLGPHTIKNVKLVVCPLHSCVRLCRLVLILMVPSSS